MTAQQKSRLTKQAFQLFALGLEVGRRRGKLCRLVAKGVPYRSPEMIEALRRFQVTQQEWQELEAQYLELRGFLMQGRCGA